VPHLGQVVCGLGLGDDASDTSSASSAFVERSSLFGMSGVVLF
jgi:hypothetical protein